MMYLKEKELEQALREDMESTIENYGGDSMAEDVICYCYDSMLSVIKQLSQYKEEITCPVCGKSVEVMKCH